MTPDAPWTAFRRHFRGLDEAIYLDTASHGARSDRVAEAFARYLADWRVDPPWDGAWRTAVDDARRAFARIVGAAADEVVLVPTVTHALHAVLGTIDPNGRRRVVLAEDEWVSSLHAARAWPGVDAVTAPSDEDDRALLGAIDDATAWVVVSHVCFRTGRRRDLRSIAERADRHGARVFVDAFQSAGVVPVDLHRTGVDAVAAGALKYLLGVPGAAFLAVRDDVAADLRPGVTGWRGQRDPMDGRLDPAAGAARFGTGTWMVPAAYAAHAGMTLLLDAGLDAVHARVRALATDFVDALAEAGVRHASPADPERRAAIVVVPHPDAEAAGRRLREAGVVCTARGGALRFSFHAYLTPDEVRRAAHHVASLHERTPCVARA